MQTTSSTLPTPFPTVINITLRAAAYAKLKERETELPLIAAPNNINYVNFRLYKTLCKSKDRVYRESEREVRRRRKRNETKQSNQSQKRMLQADKEAI